MIDPSLLRGNAGAALVVVIVTIMTVMIMVLISMEPQRQPPLWGAAVSAFRLLQHQQQLPSVIRTTVIDQKQPTSHLLSSSSWMVLNVERGGGGGEDVLRRSHGPRRKQLVKQQQRQEMKQAESDARREGLQQPPYSYTTTTKLSSSMKYGPVTTTHRAWPSTKSSSAKNAYGVDAQRAACSSNKESRGGRPITRSSTSGVVKFRTFDHMLDSLRNESILVLFTSATCGPCKLQRRELDRAQQKHKQHSKNTENENDDDSKMMTRMIFRRIFAIEIDRWPQIGSRYEVGKLPCMLLMKNKEVLLRLEGLTTADDIVDQVQQLSSVSSTTSSSTTS